MNRHDRRMEKVCRMENVLEKNVYYFLKFNSEVTSFHEKMKQG